ncbi:MAG: hypothetical protein DYH03_15010 [Nitrospira sp. NTP1]|nr:hypothetical protein [Nitrospira sp. NTP1]
MERRDTPRYEIKVPLTFSGHAVDGSGMITSLSKEGCHVTSEESLPMRANLSLHVQFPAPYEPLTVEVAGHRTINAVARRRSVRVVFVHTALRFPRPNLS